MKRKMICFMMLILFVFGFLPCGAQASDEPVEVGGIHILKTDITGNPLVGAVFQLVRIAREEELTDRSVEKMMMKIGDENRIVVRMPFRDTRAMTGDKQLEVTTDQEGKAAIYGLPYGTYYLVEVDAPEGYNRITSPIRVTIHKYSHLTEADNVRDDENKVIDNTLHIINVRYTLPDTGNLGRIQLTAAGAGILLSSAALLMLNRGRWRS